jgi:hypothetical protein
MPKSKVYDVYAYRTTHEFLHAWAQKRGLLTKPLEEMDSGEKVDVLATALTDIMTLAQLNASVARVCCVRAPGARGDMGDFDLGIMMAVRDPYIGLPKKEPPKEVVERLRRVLGFEHQPEWVPRVA